MSIMPQEPLKIFEEVDEFELILCGTPIIQVDEWKENTVYRESFNEQH
jgi:hypothetical protein